MNQSVFESLATYVPPSCLALSETILCVLLLFTVVTVGLGYNGRIGIGWFNRSNQTNQPTLLRNLSHQPNTEQTAQKL